MMEDVPMEEDGAPPPRKGRKQKVRHRARGHAPFLFLPKRAVVQMLCASFTPAALRFRSRSLAVLGLLSCADGTKSTPTQGRGHNKGEGGMDVDRDYAKGRYDTLEGGGAGGAGPGPAKSIEGWIVLATGIHEVSASGLSTRCPKPVRWSSPIARLVVQINNHPSETQRQPSKV